MTSCPGLFILFRQAFFIYSERQSAGVFHIRPVFAGKCQLQVGGERAAVKDVVENVVIGHGRYALSSVRAMNTSMSP